jgi:outer membrane lipoprotein-sorting protein
MKNFVLLIVIALSIFVGASVDSVKKMPPLLKAAETKTLSASTLKTEFLLTIIWVLKDTTEHKKGSFILKKPNMYRVELGEALFVNDGKTFSRYSPGLKQLVIQDGASLGDEFQPGEWLFKYSDRFDASIGVPENIDNIPCESYELTPKTKDRFQKLEISISIADSLPKRIMTIDRNGNEAEYLLNKIKLNEKVSTKVFAIKAPKGTETIDLRE